MKDEANIVEQYANSDVGERIDILIKYYPGFIRLVEGFERSLSFIIKQEKEMRRRAAIGELGVRVQTSHISDPTAREAIDNVMIEEAIKSGDLTDVIDELDEATKREHEIEVRTIRDMKEDYSIFKNSFLYLQPDEADIYEKYLSRSGNADALSYELDLKLETLRSKISRYKKVVVEQTSNILIRKYKIDGGKK